MKKLTAIGAALASLFILAPITTNATMKSTPIYNSGGRTNRMLITQTTGVKHTSPTPRPSLPTGKGLGSSSGIAKNINSIINQNGGNNSTALNRRTTN